MMTHSPPKNRGKKSILDTNVGSCANLLKGSTNESVSGLDSDYGVFSAKQVGKIDRLKVRAGSKYHTKNIVLPLMYIKGSPMNTNYNAAYRCSSVIDQRGKRMTARYCNSRACNGCNRIRAGKMINAYKEHILKFESLQFTTLTIANVTSDKLDDAIQFLIKTSTNIIRVLNEKRGIPISGIRKVECTYNPNRDKEKHNYTAYHPHIHILHDNKEQGNTIISEHIKRCKKAGVKVSMSGQHTEPANQNSLNEIFKYAAKDIIQKDKKTKTTKIFVYALDNIFKALYKKRTIQPFGKLQKMKVVEADENLNELQSEEIEELIENNDTWNWTYGYENVYDWISKKTGALLTGYQPPDDKYITITTPNCLAEKTLDTEMNKLMKTHAPHLQINLENL